MLAPPSAPPLEGLPELLVGSKHYPFHFYALKSLLNICDERGQALLQICLPWAFIESKRGTDKTTRGRTEAAQMVLKMIQLRGIL